jgi:hypothetical protein
LVNKKIMGNRTSIEINFIEYPTKRRTLYECANYEISSNFLILTENISTGSIQKIIPLSEIYSFKTTYDNQKTD